MSVLFLKARVNSCTDLVHTRVCVYVCAFISGAFSNVYKAMDRETQEWVAIKIVRKFELSPHQVSNRMRLVCVHG